MGGTLGAWDNPGTMGETDWSVLNYHEWELRCQGK
jgi:hypothetical protein